MPVPFFCRIAFKAAQGDVNQNDEIFHQFVFLQNTGDYFRYRDSRISRHTVNFTAAQGYTDGTLNGQPSPTALWNYSANDPTQAYFVVDSSAGTLTTSQLGFSATANYLTPVAYGNGITVTDNILFTITASGPSSGVDGAIVGVGLDNGTGQFDYSTGYEAGIGPTFGGVDQYFLTIYNSGVSSIGVSGFFIGLAGSTGTSDPLELQFTQSKSSDGSTTSLTATLFNLTTSGSMVLTTDIAGDSMGSTVYGQLLTQDGSDYSIATVTQFTSLSSVPEPSTLMTFALGAFGLAALIRRRARI